MEQSHLYETTSDSDMSDSGKTQAPHIAIFPSSGMGHLTPALRLAASLANQNIQVTFITIQPNVSLAESQFVSLFLSAFPQVTSKKFHLLPFDPSTVNSKDPFFLQMEAIRCSVPLLSPLLSSCSPPLSALITDIFMASCVIPITTQLHLPNYILYTSSAMMSCFTAYSPALLEASSTQITEDVHIPGLATIPKSWIPPLLHDLTNLFATLVIANGRALKESNGILINTFDSLEPELLKDLKEGKVVCGLPPVIPIGLLPPCRFERGSELQWLNDQPEGSIVYVSFGSRTAMSREQIRELGAGLLKSGCKFLWVVKFSKVDKNEEGGEEEVLGSGLVEELKEKGLLINSWVDQTQILSHPSIGGFVSHCGWNSVTEAAMHGVRVLAWPQHGDQKMNAAIVKKCGLGMWVESWGWPEEKLVKGEEIAEKIRELMGDEGLKVQADKMREEVSKSVGAAARWVVEFTKW